MLQNKEGSSSIRERKRKRRGERIKRERLRKEGGGGGERRKGTEGRRKSNIRFERTFREYFNSIGALLNSRSLFYTKFSFILSNTRW